METVFLWLALIDEGRYDKSYRMMTGDFKEEVPNQAALAAGISCLRGGFSDIIGREYLSIGNGTVLAGMPDGEYKVVAVKTSSKNGASLRETVRLFREKKEDKWMVAGYSVSGGPLPSASGKPTGGHAADRPDGDDGAAGMHGKMSFGPIMEHRDPTRTTGERVTLTVPVLMKGSLNVKPEDVKISVRFFDKVNGKKVERTRVPTPSFQWITAPADWADGREIMEITYDMPPLTKDEVIAYGSLNYYGYIAELYYKREAMDCQASTPVLLLLEQMQQETSSGNSTGVHDEGILPPIDAEHIENHANDAAMLPGQTAWSKMLPNVAAMETALSCLVLMDAGKYDETYGLMDEVSKKKGTPAELAQTLVSIRKPLGERRDRKWFSIKDGPSLPEMRDFECKIVKFKTFFLKDVYKLLIEHVMVVREKKGGEWKVAGYMVETHPGVVTVSSDKPEWLKTAAMKAALSWLALIDEGQYDESYRMMEELGREAKSPAKFAKYMSTNRKSLGKVRFRNCKMLNREEPYLLVPDRIGTTMLFESSFENEVDRVEIVSLLWDERDEAWKVFIYDNSEKTT